MTTDRPRIQAYIEPEVHQRLKAWQEQHGLKESPALNEILKQFFGMSPEPSIPGTLSLPQEDIEKIVKDEVSQLFRCQLEDNADFFINRLSQRVAMVEQSLERFINSSDARINEIQEDLGERLATLEEICQPIEGLAELSKPIESSELNLTQLARRLSISKSVVSNRKARPDFEEWSRGKDPNAIAWRYDRKNQKFYPVEGDS